MKLRIRDNSVRFRLMQGEVARFGREGAVEARTAFPSAGEFRYCLQSDTESDAISAEFAGNAITVRVPAAMAAEWCGSEQVGISAALPLDNGSTLAVLIEKDYACLKPRDGEDESDMYPHPKTQ